MTCTRDSTMTADNAPAPTFTMPPPMALSVPRNEDPAPECPLELFGGGLTATTWVPPVSAPKRPPIGSVRYVTVGAGDFVAGFVAGLVAAGFTTNEGVVPGAWISEAVVTLMLLLLFEYVTVGAGGFVAGFVAAGFTNNEGVVPAGWISEAVTLGVAFAAGDGLVTLLVVLLLLAFAAAAACAAACAAATAACSEADVVIIPIFSSPAGWLLDAGTACRPVYLVPWT